MNIISPATAAAFAAALYFAAVMAARVARWSPVAATPVLVGAVLVFYVVIVAVATRRAGIVRRVGGFITLVALHAAIVWATAYVWALATRTPFASTLSDALWAFPPAAILQALCVPVMAWPLRGLFARPSVARPVKLPRRRAVAPLPKAHAVPWPLAAPAPTPTVDTVTAEEPVALPSAVSVEVVTHAPDHETVSRREPSLTAADAAMLEATAVDRDAAQAWRTRVTLSAPQDGRTARDEDRIRPVERGVAQVEPTIASPGMMPAREMENAHAHDGVEDQRLRAVMVMPTTGADRHASAAGRSVPTTVVTVPAAAYPADGDGTASVRIRFETVADQIPHDVLTASPAHIAARLPDPGYVLVPEAFVVSQLAEGLVRVPWEVIGRQLPDAAFSGTRAAIAGRLADVAIELPLAEIVSQLSPDVFADALEPVDVTGIESFPMPFNPSTETVVTAEVTVTPASAEPEPPVHPLALAMSDAPAVSEPALVMSEPAPVVSDTAPVVNDSASVVSDTALAAPLVEEYVGGPDVFELEADLRVDEVDRESLPEVLVPDPIHVEPVAVDAEPTPWVSVVAEPPDVAVASQPDVPAPVLPREIRALFARLNRFEIDAEMVGGVTLHRLAGPDMSAQALREMAARLLSPLRRGWSRHGLDQITVRGATAAVVVTALGDLDGAGAVLVAGTRRGPGLALVELLGRRGAAAWPSASRTVTAPTLPVPDGDAAGDLDGEGLAWVAPALAAFGPVDGRRFPGDGDVVYAFVDPRLVAPEVAAFAREVVDAVTSAGVAELGPLESVTGRYGAEQVVIRAVARPLGVPWLVVAAGAVDRPGLAHRQVERAAALLIAETV